jgi:uncharacterized membrane protein YjfL (UPF0719 family)
VLRVLLVPCAVRAVHPLDVLGHAAVEAEDDAEAARQWCQGLGVGLLNAACMTA